MESKLREAEKLNWESIDEAELKARLEAKIQKWYYVSGALDFVKNGREKIERIIEFCGTNQDQLQGLLAMAVEEHMMHFTPAIWKEPIRVVASTNYEAGPIVADYLRQTLFLQPK